MSERPKAAAGMVWLPKPPEVWVGNEWQSCNLARPAWHSPATIQRAWLAEESDSREPGTVVAVGSDWYFYRGLDPSQVLDVLAEAWKQRGGR